MIATVASQCAQLRRLRYSSTVSSVATLSEFQADLRLVVPRMARDSADFLDCAVNSEVAQQI